MTIKSRALAREMKEDRFADTDKESEETDDTFMWLRKHWAVRLLLFVDSTTFGIVNVYGMQGIPWTKAIASIFWSSYLLLELLGILAWSSTGGESTTDEPSSLLLPSLYGEHTQKTGLENVAFSYIIVSDLHI